MHFKYSILNLPFILCASFKDCSSYKLHMKLHLISYRTQSMSFVRTNWLMAFRKIQEKYFVVRIIWKMQTV